MPDCNSSATYQSQETPRKPTIVTKNAMCSPDQDSRILPATATTAPRRKRPRELALVLYEPAVAEQQQARALVPLAAAPVRGEPIDAVPLAAAAPRAEPSWIRKHLLPHLKLRADLPVHFIDEKVVTATDFDPTQNRFRLPTDGVLRNLRPILTAKEVRAANLLPENDHRPTRRRALPPPPPPPTAGAEGEQGRVRKKRKGKDHGGLPVLVVDARAGIAEQELVRWDSSLCTVIKGQGYLKFLRRCSFTVDDVVEIWAFKQHEFRLFGFTVEESPLYFVIAKKQ